MQRLLTVGFLWLIAALPALATPWGSRCIQNLYIGQSVSQELTTADCNWYFGSSPNDRYYTDVYSFVGAAGQQISISASSSAFNTTLELYNVNEVSATPLVTDDNGGGGTNSRIPAGSGTYALPTAGTYYIWIYGQANATGAYTLSLNGTPTAGSRNAVQKAYVAYYGRPADPAGQLYWAARMDAEGGSLAAIIDAFGTSDEFNRRYGGLSNRDLVIKIYQQALARDPDQAGLDWYVAELNAGRRTLRTITLDVLNGATGNDATTVANKLTVADYYTSKVDAGCSYGSEQTGVSALMAVTYVASTVTVARAAIDTQCSGTGRTVSDDSQLEFDGISPAPPMSIVPQRPMSGRSVNVTVAAPGATSIAVAVSGGGCGTLTGSTVTGALWMKTGTTADDGYCDLTATATYSGGTTKIIGGHFEVQASTPDLPPVTPEGGVYIQRPFPSASTTGPRINGIDGPPGFVNGGSGTYTVRYAGAERIVGALVQVPGYEGYYRVPVSSSNGTVSLDLRFASDYFTTTPSVARQRAALHRAMAATGQLSLNFALIDWLGAISNAFPLSLNPAQAATGDVKVSIAWDTPTDVDLWVNEPSGERIYYGHRTSATGGHLDVDSNAGCRIDNINNENITWPSGQAPNGQFKVTVHMYESGCGTPPGPAGASGTLTMSYCGADSPKVIPFTLAAQGAKQEFTFTSLCGSRVSGTVKFEDFPVIDTGLGASAMVPVRYAKVEVVRSNGTAAQDVVMAEGMTNGAGKYDIPFVNDKPEIPGFYVRVKAQQNNSWLKQEVQSQAGAVYEFRTPKATEPLIDGAHPPADGKGFKVDLEVKKADNAGAFNIFDVGIDAYVYQWVHTGKTLPFLTFKWSSGTQRGSWYQANVISVGGDTAQSDEYDDVVIGHEYGHFLMDKLSLDNTPGGAHSSNQQSDPKLAWSEGWATFFAITSQKRTSYADTKPTGMAVFYDLETLPPEKPKGNKNNALSGDLSEAVVASVLLDLADSSNETNDTISDKGTAIWSIVTTYLAPGYAKFADRGVVGRDLVDFLDGWICLGYGDIGADDTKGLRGIVKTLSGLSYDFPTLASCK